MASKKDEEKKDKKKKKTFFRGLLGKAEGALRGRSLQIETALKDQQ